MSLAELATAFGLGVGATLSPCALPLYPGFLAYLAAGGASGARSDVARWLGLFVLAGVLATMIVAGALMAALSLAAGSVLRVITPLAYAVVIGLGVALVVGRSPFARLPAIAGSAGGEHPVRAAFVYGLLYGPIALPCSAPLLVSIFALSLGVADLAPKLVFFLVFGLGFGLPLLGLSLLAEGRQRALLRLFTRHYQVVSRVAGALLVVVGAWSLAQEVGLLTI